MWVSTVPGAVPLPSTAPVRLHYRLISANFQVVAHVRKSSSFRRVWRRRKLTKWDDLIHNNQGRIPFLEEQVRIVREGGEHLSHDIGRLLLSEDNRFGFVNEVAAEATELVRSNRDEYGGTKKAILHVLSNRMNDIGYARSDAYEQSDPYKPPGYLKEHLT